MRNIKRSIIALALCAMSSTAALADTPSSTATSSDALSPTQVEQVKKIISSYLVENPQILVAASQALQQQMMAQAEQKAKVAIVKYKTDIFDDSKSPVIGNPNGNVALVEFMDYQCVHCRDMYPIVEDMTKSNKNLKVIIKELPIFGGSSTYAAQAALAAYNQGAAKFAAFHNALFDTDPPLTKDNILAAARKVGLNVSKLTKDMESDAVKQEIKENFTLAQNLALVGTPAFIMGNANASQTAFIPGATTKEDLQQAISKLADSNGTQK